MDLEERLRAHQQEHLLDVSGLTEEARREYISRLEKIDFDAVERWRAGGGGKRGAIAPIEGLRISAIEAERPRFRAAGEAAIREGKVAAVLLAGGQGTRLGSPAPKGTYDIGITKPLYIFEQLIRNLLAVCGECGAYVPLFVMTSEKNDAETRAFFAEHHNFGYPDAFLRFFPQELTPCVGFDGKILLEEKGKLALSPNGNGGWYSSLVRAGHLKDFPAVEWINVFAVDNVLQRIADPVFIGATILSGKKCGAKVVVKARPEEKVGVLCLEDGLPSVVEYYELSPEMANERDGNGDLRYLYGVILNYLFDARRLEEIAQDEIPVHVVKKKVPCLDPNGVFTVPETENAYKFETLILDMVHLMGDCLPFEVVREREFAPIKNRTGVDSVDTARVLLQKNGVEL